MGSMNTNRPVIASGTVQVCSFLMMDTTRDYAAKQATAGALTLGVSQAAPRQAPNLDQALFGATVATSSAAAISGEELQVFSIADVCGLIAGAGGWHPGDLLQSDGDGNGVTASAGGYCGARSFSACNQGEIGEVEVLSPWKL